MTGKDKLHGGKNLYMAQFCIMQMKVEYNFALNSFMSLIHFLEASQIIQESACVGKCQFEP
jgi:hypothetical protein